MSDKEKKEQISIPAGKIQRAARFMRTGAKVGRNYATHYTKKLFNRDLDRSELDARNADDIYKELSKLKGSALKMAQMMSMDKGMLPREYVERFTNAQYNAPPLSGPLVVKTIRQSFGKGPEELFDEFDMKAVNAASIGQVHRAKKDGKDLAVKIQYPGVAKSITSDLRLVKPIAARIARVKSEDLAPVFEEVEERLLEETDYNLELQRSIEISQACAHIPNLRFPTYYPELSSDKVITMEWLDGLHMKEFMATEPSEEIRNQIGQTLWNFINFQMHELGKVHADPHPGNFLLTQDGQLGVLDFGCVKVVPPDFYRAYFSVIHPTVRNSPERLLETTYQLELLDRNDTEKDKAFILGILTQFLDLLEKPFYSNAFDFGDDGYIDSIYQFGLEVGQMSDAQQNAGRGSKHAIYINRTFFGLFLLLNQLKATVDSSDKYIMQMEF